MPGGASTRPPESLRDLRRAEIVAAARRIVAEDGLEGLTIATLEARLAFTRGVITYHFRDKDEIVMAVLASALQEIDAATAAEVGASRSIEEKVGAVVRTKVFGFLDHREAGRILLSFWGRIGSTPSIRAANARLYVGYREQARRLLAATEGEHRGGPDHDAFAALLVGVVIGIVTQAYFDPGAIDAEAAVEEAARTLAGRLAPPPAPRRGSGAGAKLSIPGRKQPRRRRGSSP